jgi:cobalt-zinc-cadmium efflux system membrane fusion protein
MNLKSSFIVIAGLLLASCGGGKDPATDTVERASMKQPDVLSLAPEVLEQGGIESAPVTTRELHETFEVTGRIQLDEDRTARVGSPAEGRVASVRIRLGDHVRRGDPLLDIHSHELIVARADYDKAKADVAAAERRLRYAETELARANRLLEAKALSDRERLFAASELVAIQSELSRALSERTRATDYLDHLGVTDPESAQGGDIVVRAPLDGVVLEREVTLGTVVNPADDLVLLADLSTLWVVGEVPERQATMVHAEQEAEVEVAAFPGEHFSARVFHIGETLDPSLRTVRVRATLENPDGRLRPEMYATMWILLDPAPAAIVVPESALQTIEGDSVVFVDLGEGRFEKRAVEITRRVDGWAEVASGVVEDERVVSVGSFLVKSELLRGRLAEE